jgi:hypothetical protein
LPGNTALRKCIGDGPLRRRQPERNYLHGQGKTAEDIDPFGIVGDHDHAIRRRRHDLLPQQRAAAALDQVERGIEFVGAIDGEIEPVDLVERGQGDLALLRLNASNLRGRYADHAQPTGNPLAQQFDKMLRGRTGAEPQLHAILHMLQRLRRSLSLQSIHIHELNAS